MKNIALATALLALVAGSASAQTPQQAATAINRFYERSADNTGGREANALRLSRLLGGR